MALILLNPKGFSLKFHSYKYILHLYSTYKNTYHILKAGVRQCEHREADDRQRLFVRNRRIPRRVDPDACPDEHFRRRYGQRIFVGGVRQLRHGKTRLR